MSYYVHILIGSWGSVVGMVTGLCAGFPRNCGSFLERVKSISVLQCASLCKASGSPSGPTQSLIQWVLGDLALVVEHLGMKLTIHPI